MYNCLQKYLKVQDILYDKQFGFQSGHSTDHTIAQLVDQIYEAFEKNEYTLDVFIDLSKAFDAVDHSTLLRKLELHIGITHGLRVIFRTPYNTFKLMKIAELNFV